MNDRRSRVRLGVLLGLYLVILGGLPGVAAERVRFDRQRPRVLARHDAAVRAQHAALMGIEQSADVRGRNVAGAEAFKRDIPGAVVRFFDVGHFALETHAAEIATEIREFLAA